jgi:hypothetical protein
VDNREYITATVSYSGINDGKGVAVFNTDDGEVYLWKPSKTSPHGTVKRVDTLREYELINPYITVYQVERNMYIPVHSSSGTYLTYNR